MKAFHLPTLLMIAVCVFLIMCKLRCLFNPWFIDANPVMRILADAGLLLLSFGILWAITIIAHLAFGLALFFKGRKEDL
jgi:hypothetical protein